MLSSLDCSWLINSSMSIFCGFSLICWSYLAPVKRLKGFGFHSQAGSWGTSDRIKTRLHFKNIDMSTMATSRGLLEPVSRLSALPKSRSTCEEEAKWPNKKCAIGDNYLYLFDLDFHQSNRRWVGRTCASKNSLQRYSSTSWLTRSVNNNNLSDCRLFSIANRVKFQIPSALL